MELLRLGDLAISRIVEYEGPTNVDFLFQEGTADKLQRHDGWLAPHFFNPERGKLVMSIHTFIIRTAHHTILVDTCVGNHKKRSNEQWNMLEGPYLDRLKGAGVDPEKVDYVLCTHLHVDHVGWNTCLQDGRWVPTFPNARYLFARKEWEHWKDQPDGDTPEIMNDSVRPIIEANLADLVDGEHEIATGLRLEPTPGHTPGHVSLNIKAGGQEAVITGDMMHHPVQMAEVDWCSRFCVEPAQAIATRKAFLERYADRDVRVLGTHFAAPVAGRVVGAKQGWRFEV